MEQWADHEKYGLSMVRPRRSGAGYRQVIMFYCNKSLSLPFLTPTQPIQNAHPPLRPALPLTLILFIVRDLCPLAVRLCEIRCPTSSIMYMPPTLSPHRRHNILPRSGHFRHVQFVLRHVPLSAAAGCEGVFFDGRGAERVFNGFRVCRSGAYVACG